MRIIIGYESAFLKPMLNIPELMRLVLEYLDCSSLISLSMSNKKYFGLQCNDPLENSSSLLNEIKQESEIELKSSIEEQQESFLMMDVNLWKYLVYFHQEAIKKLSTFEYIYNMRDPYRDNDESQHLKLKKKTWTEIYKARSELTQIFETDTLKKHKLIMSYVGQLKGGLYARYRTVSSLIEYHIDYDRNGRASCRYKGCKINGGMNDENRIEVGSLRGKTVKRTNYEGWYGVFHLDCFIHVLSENHVNVQELKYDRRVDPDHRVHISSQLSNLLREQKNHRYCVYTCDICSTLLNQVEIFQRRNNALPKENHLCNGCFTNSGHTYVDFQKIELPPVHNCSLCKKCEMKDVMFYCKCCEDTFICRECIQEFKWIEHKTHEISIVGEANDKDVESLKTDFKPIQTESIHPINLATLENEQSRIPQEKIMSTPNQETIPEITKKNKRKTRVSASTRPKKVQIVDFIKPMEESEQEVTENNQSSSEIQNNVIDKEHTCSNEGGVDSILSDDEEEKDVYEVEKVLNCKTIRKKKHYLIQWKGYPESDNSWEPVENVSSDLVKAFNQENKLETRRRKTKK